MNVALYELNETAAQVILRGDIEELRALAQHTPGALNPALWPVAMHQASSREITRFLLAQGVDPNACSAPRKPLHFAVHQGWPDIVDELLAAGADPQIRDGEGFTPLDLYGGLVTAEPGVKAAIVASFRRAGAEITVWTALRIGATDEALGLLRADSSLVHATSPDLAFTPLQVAARTADLAALRWLLANGAEVDAGENTALWFACQSSAPAEERIPAAEMLLQAGAAPNRRCENGSTPLHFGAWRGPLAMVQLLLAHGADPTLRDEGGESASDYAQSSQVNPDATACAELLAK